MLKRLRYLIVIFTQNGSKTTTKTTGLGLLHSVTVAQVQSNENFNTVFHSTVQQSADVKTGNPDIPQ